MSLRLTVLLALAFLFGTVGCGLFGGGDGETAGGDEFEMLEFDQVQPTPQPLEDIVKGLTLNPEVLVEVRYLYGHQVMLEDMRRVSRDLQSLLSYSGPGDVDLEWVIQVHEVTAEADEVFGRLTSSRIPGPLRERYEDLFLDLLDAIQVTGYGADRLLAASIKVGPSGRTLMAMSGQELADFETLVREGRFYLMDGGRLIEKQLSGMDGLIGKLRLR